MSSDPLHNQPRLQHAAQYQAVAGKNYRENYQNVAGAAQTQYAFANAVQSVYPNVYPDSAAAFGPQHQQQNKKRGYDDDANNFFEDAKRSRVEPVYNPAMAQRLTGLNTYINDGWNYIDQNYNTSLPALKDRQDLLEIDQWLYQLSSTLEQGSNSPQAFRSTVSSSQSSVYPNVPAMLQNDYSQSLCQGPTGSVYPNIPASNFAFPGHLASFAGNTVLPQMVTRYTEPRRTIDISQLQAAPSSAKESSIRDTPVKSAVDVPATPRVTEDITSNVERLSIVDEKAAAEERAKHGAMIKTMREAIATMVKKMEDEASIRKEDAAAAMTLLSVSA